MRDPTGGHCDIRFIQEMLGLANLETTEIYTRVSFDEPSTVGIGMFNATIFVEGLFYALRDGGSCTCKK